MLLVDCSSNENTPFEGVVAGPRQPAADPAHPRGGPRGAHLPARPEGPGLGPPDRAPDQRTPGENAGRLRRPAVDLSFPERAGYDPCVTSTTTNRVPVDDDRFHDRCGVFGIFGHPDAAHLTYLGLYALQHRGQESAGIVASDGDRVRLERGMGLVNEVFTRRVPGAAPGRPGHGPRALLHGRGHRRLVNAQP